MDRKKHDKDTAHKKEHEPAPASREAADGEAAAGGDRVKELEEALAAKDAECRQNWDKYLRERADLENYRKRVQKEKEEILKYGNESFISEILPVIDSMERALVHADGEAQSAVIDGVRLTHGMLLSALKKFGVSPIETNPGTPFDPAFHQAMQQVESADLPVNSVVQEFQRGYLLNDRLLRPAMVSVAAAPREKEA